MGYKIVGCISVSIWREAKKDKRGIEAKLFVADIIVSRI